MQKDQQNRAAIQTAIPVDLPTHIAASPRHPDRLLILPHTPALAKTHKDKRIVLAYGEGAVIRKGAVPHEVIHTASLTPEEIVVDRIVDEIMRNAEIEEFSVEWFYKMLKKFATCEQVGLIVSGYRDFPQSGMMIVTVRQKKLNSRALREVRSLPIPIFYGTWEIAQGSIRQ